MKTTQNICDLADYPAIKKLASALHQFDANQQGAAILIGAGFSRSAARHVGGDRKMPLWYEFSERLAEELNPNDKVLRFSDPLRIAEEYRAYFGQAALNDRIRSEIDDDVWRVGELYKTLLELPWSEVMTTNWDTLLERAAKDIHSPYYTPVTKPSDLTWASSPRIVKLHGTIGTTDTFIAAQEDYRTYPQKFAPFVNFARQVFIENELCLLGFSGDDPNFLHWAGWVRDHLAGHARKIYLVGALNLTAARRRHLESINIAPIDLWDAVKQIDDRDLRHQTATELFLHAMMVEGNSKVEPHNWTPSSLHAEQVAPDALTRQFNDPDYAATLLKWQLETLQKDRESYPGWLVCPPVLLWRLQNQLSAPYPTAKNIAALAPNDRAGLLYEIAWRHSITFQNIDPWLAEALYQVANPDEPCSLSKRQQMEIALVLLRNSRWLNAVNESDQQVIHDHIKALIAILEKHAQYLPDCVAELAYHQALIARDAFDYVGMEALVEKIQGEDPVWKLRQASLLMELGQFGEGEKLIALAYGELRENYRRDRHSIAILSRLMWAHWLLDLPHWSKTNQTPEKLSDFAESIYRKWKCDPWTWIEDIREKVSEQQERYLKNQNPVEPSFEQGHYRHNQNSRSSNIDISVFLLLEGLGRSVGVPLRADHVSLLAGSAEKLVLSGGTGIELWDYSLAIRAASSESSPSINNVFTRIGVARASQAVVDTLVIRILPAIAYWRGKRGSGTLEQQGHALSVLRTLMEVLARLVVRVPPEKAKEIFRLAISLGLQQNLHHHWLFDAIDSLLSYSVQSIPESEQGELLADALAFPLQSEWMKSDFPRCPNPIINHPGPREAYPGIEKRIGELIDAVTPSGSPSGTAALLRLLPLVERDGFLTQTEHDKLANALWGIAPNYQTLPNTGLLPHALLLLPAPDANKVKTLVQTYLYEHGEDVLQDANKSLRSIPSPEVQRVASIYGGMANAAANQTTKLFPTPEQAVKLFDRLIVWRPHFEKDDPFGASFNARKQLIESIGNSLSYAIAPALSSEAKTVKRFEQLKSLFDEVDGAHFLIPAFVYFAPINKAIEDSVEKIIRKSMQGRDVNVVSYAALAVQKWAELSEKVSSKTLNGLISRLIVIIESGRTVGLQQLLYVADELFKKQRLSEEQVATLIEAVPNVFDAADYHNIEPNSQEAISASSIREACVKLAIRLVAQYQNATDLQSLLKASLTDALPEVRFANNPHES